MTNSFVPVIAGSRTLNRAGGEAYLYNAQHALVQYAVTGTLNGTYYCSGVEHAETVNALATAVTPEFLAKTAVYARSTGRMKELPAALLAVLAANPAALGLLERVFTSVIDNGKMLRLFVKHLRSGQFGRRSFGSAVRRLIRGWFEVRTDVAVYRQSIGSNPSFADIIRMVHPRPTNDSRSSLYRYLLGREDYELGLLPAEVQALEEFRRGEAPEGLLPNVPFEVQLGLTLSEKNWKDVARSATFNQIRNNLATFARHGVFTDPELVAFVASRLRDRGELERSGCFPYQLLNAYLNTADGVPFEVREALQDAMEVATENVPALEGNVVVCLDVSGSMKDPVTGRRRGSSSKVRCVDVAGLMAATILGKNPRARVIPFEGQVVQVTLNPRDTVMTNAERLAAVGGGSTNCSAPLRLLNRENAAVDTVVMISDNESWLGWSGDATPMSDEWNQLKLHNPQAKLCLIDITPNTTTQVRERADVMNIGGFSDAVFDLLAEFAQGQSELGALVRAVEAVAL